MQLTIVIFILVAAAALAARHLYKMLTAKEKGCTGCPLKDVCDKGKPGSAGCKPRLKPR